MKNVFLFLFSCLFNAHAFAAEPKDPAYPFVAVVSKPVNFTKEDIKNVPFLNEKFFGNENVNAVDEEGNFYWRGISREQLIDIRSLARKGETLEVQTLRSKPSDLIKFANIVEAWGLVNLKSQLINLFYYCLELDIKKLSKSPYLKKITLKKISILTYQARSSSKLYYRKR